MSSALVIDFKLGDTYVLSGRLSTGGSIAGYGIRSQIKNGDELIKDLTVSVTNAALGDYQSAPVPPSETALWPLADLTSDVEFTDTSGKIFSTETFIIRTHKDQTA